MRKDLTKVTLLLASLGLLNTARAAHEPGFSVNTETGTYSFESQAISLKDIQLEAGNQKAQTPPWNVLKGAKMQPGSSATKAIYVATDPFWEVTVGFEIVKDGWLQVSFSAKNLTTTPRAIDPIRLASFTYKEAFKGSVDDSELRYYYVDYNIWGDSQIKKAADETILKSYYYAALFQPGRPALVMGFKPPHDWSDRVNLKGKDCLLSAEALNRTPYLINGGETVVFDPLLIGTHDHLTDGLQSFGKFYTPRTQVCEVKKYTGWNSWEYYKRFIDRKKISRVADSIVTMPELKSKINYLVLDYGWQGNVTSETGNWTMNERKFGCNIHEWVKECKAKGFIPGVWITPSRIGFDKCEEQGFAFWVKKDKGGTKYIADPSDPNYRKYLYGQLRDLRDAGVRYFKTDFLADMDLQTMHHPDRFQFSQEPGNRILRDFYKGLREAIGEDSFWLACGTTTAPLAGLADASRVGVDMMANWGITTKAYRQLSMCFWYHGNLWLNDTDFLFVMGDQQVKPEARTNAKYQPVASEIAKGRGYEGFSPAQAKTWATMIIMSGGLMTWADNPEDLNESGLRIIKTVFEHGGGHAGVPLDLEATMTPTKWVRREGKRIYLAAINVGSVEIKVRISAEEVPELKKATSAQDIFSGQTHAVQNNTLELQVPPYASHCLLLK